MAGIEFSVTRIVGGGSRGEEVQVMGNLGMRITVPCAGVAFHDGIKRKHGHYVKVIASRYTNDNPGSSLADWKPLGDDEAVLGWRTLDDADPSLWVVYLCCDRRGCLIIVPQHRNAKFGAA